MNQRTKEFKQILSAVPFKTWVRHWKDAMQTTVGIDGHITDEKIEAVRRVIVQSGYNPVVWPHRGTSGWGTMTIDHSV